MAQWVAHWVGGEVTPGFTIGIPLGLPLKHGAIGNSWRTSPFFGLGKLHTQLPGQNPQVTALCCIRSISFCILRCLGRTPTPSWDKCMATERLLPGHVWAYIRMFRGCAINVGSWLVARVAIVAIFFQIILKLMYCLEGSLLWQNKIGRAIFLKKNCNCWEAIFSQKRCSSVKFLFISLSEPVNASLSE